MNYNAFECTWMVGVVGCGQVRSGVVRCGRVRKICAPVFLWLFYILVRCAYLCIIDKFRPFENLCLR